MGKNKKKGKKAYDDDDDGNRSEFAFENKNGEIVPAPLSPGSSGKSKRKQSKKKKFKKKSFLFFSRGVSVPNLEVFDSEQDDEEYDEFEESDEDDEERKAKDLALFMRSNSNNGLNWFKSEETGVPPPVPSQSTKPKLQGAGGVPPPVPAQSTKPKLGGSSSRSLGQVTKTEESKEPPKIPSRSNKPKLGGGVNTELSNQSKESLSGPPPIPSWNTKPKVEEKKVIPPMSSQEKNQYREELATEMGNSAGKEPTEEEINDALRAYSRRVKELVAFYQRVDPDRENKVKHCRALLRKYPPGNVAIAVKKKYGEFPEGWEKYYKTATEAMLYSGEN